MQNENLTCPICGEPTNVYMGKARKDRLCRKHGMMKNAGEIDVNAEGLFFEVATGKILNPPAEAPKKVEELKIYYPPKVAYFLKKLKLGI